MTFKSRLGQIGHGIVGYINKAAQQMPKTSNLNGEYNSLAEVVMDKILKEYSINDSENDQTQTSSSSGKAIGVTGLALCVLGTMGGCNIGDGSQAYNAQLVDFSGTVNWSTYVSEYTPVTLDQKLVMGSQEYGAFMFRVKKENEGNVIETSGGELYSIEGPLKVPDVNGDGIIGEPR